MTIVIDGTCMTSREAAYSYLHSRLDLPPYCGRNLDALYDVLTERAEPTCLTLVHTEAVREALGEYGSRLLETLREAAQVNPALEIREDPPEN